MRSITNTTKGDASHDGGGVRRPRRHRRFGGIVLVAGIGLALGACNSASNGASPSAQAAERLLLAGANAQVAGNVVTATSDYQSALKIDPESANAAYDLGDLAQELGQTTQAMQYYAQALAENPKMTQAMFNEAVLVTPTQPALAEQLYNQILTIQPSASTTYFNLGLLLIQQTPTKPQGLQYLAQAVHLDSSLASRLPAGVSLPSSVPAQAAPAGH